MLYHYQLRFHYHNEMSDSMYQIFEKINVLAIFESWIGLEKAYYQLERKGSYDHWQCHLIFDHQLDNPTSEARTELGLNNAETLINLYMKPAKEPNASIAYCTKWQTRVLGPFIYDYGVEPVAEYACTICNDNGCILCRHMLTNAHENP